VISKLQKNETTYLDELVDVKEQINKLYQDQARAAAEKLSIRDIDESEIINLYHHENHQKKMKRSAILKLDTPDKGIISGHEKCHRYLEEQVRSLLAPTTLDDVAQQTLLSGVEEVFDDDNRTSLSSEPTKKEVQAEVWRGNQTASPGTDGIILMFYKFFWNDIGDLLHAMILDNFKQKRLTKSQSVALIVFGTKPKKTGSLLVKDKRRISLLNADYKINSGIPTARLSQLSNKGLSPAQYVSGSNRRIQHCINIARDAVHAGNANRTHGCGIMDNDFQAAFDFMMSSWPIKVLLKKGCGKEFSEWIGMFFKNVKSIVVVNNVMGAIIDLYRSLRQGDIPSMCLYAYGVDPFLERLRKVLRGILIHTRRLPVLGPLLEGEAKIPDHIVEERLTAFGYADDIKNSITSKEEFAIVDQETILFEKASGSLLHRDKTSQKVKFLPLGKWRGVLKQEDLPDHVALAESLDMLGLELFANFRKTAKVSGDNFQSKSKNMIGAWLIKQIYLTQRPWSLNTFLFPKFYHRCHSIPLRQCDITEIRRHTNRFLFCDQLEKPGPIVTYRDRQSGGLGLHNVELKANALLIKCFLETAANPSFQHSLLHEHLYQAYVKKDTSIPAPKLPPYYTKKMFQEIVEASEDGRNVETMSTKEWYTYLLNKHVLEEPIEENGSVSSVPRKCKIEEEYPTVVWGATWQLARKSGLTNEARSFMFRFLHNILPTQARLHRITRNNPSPTCQLCDSGQPDILHKHSFMDCSHTNTAMSWLLDVIKEIDPAASIEKIMFLEFGSVDPCHLLDCTFLVIESLSYAWAKRKNKEQIVMIEMKAHIKAKCSMLIRSYKYKENGDFLLSTLQLQQPSQHQIQSQQHPAQHPS